MFNAEAGKVVCVWEEKNDKQSINGEGKTNWTFKLITNRVTLKLEKTSA